MPVRAEDGAELLTPAEAADALGLSRGTIKALMHKGRLTRVKVSTRVVFIPRASIEAYRHESLGRKPGPKPTGGARYGVTAVAGAHEGSSRGGAGQPWCPRTA